MSNSMNKVILMGNLGDDPELRHFSNGPMLKLRLATTDGYLDKNQQWQEFTEWHSVTVWGKRAESLERLLSKGDRIVVEGRLETRAVPDANGGQRYFTGIKARDVHLAGPLKRNRSEAPISLQSRPKSELAAQEAVL